MAKITWQQIVVDIPFITMVEDVQEQMEWIANHYWYRGRLDRRAEDLERAVKREINQGGSNEA